MPKLIVILLFAVMGQAAPTEKESEPKPPGEEVKFNDLLDESKKLGPWEKNAPLEAQAINQFFDRNGWTGPEDQFARDLVLQVNQVPPWNQQERQDIFMNALSSRYSLSSDQQRRLNRGMQRETMRLTLNHFKEIAPIAMEAVKTRASGQPFTSEQVARWSTVMRPIAEEGREAIERVGRELARDMNAQQKDLLSRDLKAFARRHRNVTEQMVKWQNGQWKAEDWGLDRDPIQSGQGNPAGGGDEDKALAEAREAALRSKAGNPQQTPGAMQPVLDNEWTRYLKDFAARHEFTAAQKVSAEGILQDLLKRAHAWREANKETITAAEARVRANRDPTRTAKLSAELEQLTSPLRQMFDELKARLDALLTAEQRSRAGK